MGRSFSTARGSDRSFVRGREGYCGPVAFEYTRASARARGAAQGGTLWNHIGWATAQRCPPTEMMTTRFPAKVEEQRSTRGCLLLALSGIQGLFILRVERSFGALQDYQDFLFRVLWQVWTVEQLQRGRMNLFKGVKQGNDFFFIHIETIQP